MMFEKNRFINFLMKYIPKQHNLKDTMLYHIIGERLFKPELWKPTRKSIAQGLAVGVFIALTPTFGVQMLISGLAAYFLQINIPIAVAAAWITNPITMPIIYPLQYKLGQMFCINTGTDEFIKYSGKLQMFIRIAKPLWIGSLISAAFFSLLSYIAVIKLWEAIEKVIIKNSSVE